jgi:hypothetical protein
MLNIDRVINTQLVAPQRIESYASSRPPHNRQCACFKLPKCDYVFTLKKSTEVLEYPTVCDGLL